MIITDKTKDFKPSVEVVGCFTQSNGEILLLHRRDDQSEGDFWGLPGGKVHPGENAKEAILRELFEETKLQLNPNDLAYFSNVFVNQRGLDFVYHMFSTNLHTRPEIKINKREHKDYVWTSPAKALELKLIHDLDTCIRAFFKF